MNIFKALVIGLAIDKPMAEIIIALKKLSTDPKDEAINFLSAAMALLDTSDSFKREYITRVHKQLLDTLKDAPNPGPEPDATKTYPVCDDCGKRHPTIEDFLGSPNPTSKEKH